jgi:hypothetical protein
MVAKRAEREVFGSAAGAVHFAYRCGDRQLRFSHGMKEDVPLRFAER